MPLATPRVPVQATKDEDIDSGSIPELDDTFWREAKLADPDLIERINRVFEGFVSKPIGGDCDEN